MGSSLEQIRLEILNNPGLEKEVRIVAEEIFEKSKQQLIQEFENHPVTKEIQAGPDASNESGTLGGRGNLFSFIGFNDGADPIAPIKELLQGIEFSSSKGRRFGSGFQFKVNMPDQGELENVSKMPWETGRSWLYDIERAISGLGQYLYGQFKNSRSGTGMQLEKNFNTNTFMPVKYFGTMLEKFKNKLKGIE